MYCCTWLETINTSHLRIRHHAISSTKNVFDQRQTKLTTPTFPVVRKERCRALYLDDEKPRRRSKRRFLTRDSPTTQTVENIQKMEHSQIKPPLDIASSRRSEERRYLAPQQKIGGSNSNCCLNSLFSLSNRCINSLSSLSSKSAEATATAVSTASLAPVAARRRQQQHIGRQHNRPNFRQTHDVNHINQHQ